MRNHKFYYNSKSKSYAKYFTLLILAIIGLIVTTFVLYEISNFYYDEPTVVRILINTFKSSEEMKPSNSSNTKLMLVNLQEQPQQLNSDRQARAATDNNTISSQQKSNSYYEEQTPVVVYAKTDMDSSIVNRQMAEIPPRQDVDEDDPYSKALEDDYGGGDESDYYGQPEPQPPAYYKQQQQQQQQPQSYYRPPFSANKYEQQQSFYHESPPNPQYYDDPRDDFASPDSEQFEPDAARSSQYHDYGSNFRKYPYAATIPPIISPGSGNKRKYSAANSNIQFTRNKAQTQYRAPFPTYTDDYDYQPTPSRLSPAQRGPYANRPSSAQQMSQYRTPNISPPAEEKQEADSQQMDFLTMFKSIKTMWDLYQSFTSSWNTLAERRNREEEMTKQKYKQQQQIRINSRKPPKFNTGRNTTTTSKSGRKPTTTSTTESLMGASSDMITLHKQEGEEQPVGKQSVVKNEPRKNVKGAKLSARDVEDGEYFRDKRQTTDVSEGRYIKGDPLKGYYDFVITEGSYKFWAAFQVGTAILIIYSTFAAIYYSKVNPLVSDYDYTDYLGGARSLSGGDLDFVDDLDENSASKGPNKSWLEWLPRTGHSLKFILDAIDKLPTDHAAEKVSELSLQNKQNTVEEEYTAETEPEANTETSDESERSSENEEVYDEKPNREAM